MDPLTPQDQRPNEVIDKKDTALEDIHLKVAKPAEKKSTFKDKLFNFISPDIVNLKTYLVDDYLKPGLKNLAGEMFHSAVDCMFGTYTRGRRDNGRRDYRRESERGRSTYESDTDRRSTRYASPNDVPFETKDQALQVFYALVDGIEDFDRVTVRAFYEAAGVSGMYPDTYRGWTDLRNFDPNRDIYRDGRYWYMNLPRAIELN